MFIDIGNITSSAANGNCSPYVTVKMNNRVFSSLFHPVKQFVASHVRPKKLLSCSRLKQSKNFSMEDEQCLSESGTPDSSTNKGVNAVIANGKYKLFDDRDAEVILDVHDEEGIINIDDFTAHPEQRNPYDGINLKRGIHGVFDIQDLCEALQKDNAKDIFVASVPRNFGYVDYMVVTTARSQKHISALATFVRKLYKLKRSESDIMPKVEGLDSKDWVALDLGNIVLHIFSFKARAYYNLETLWTVGSKYDEQHSNGPDVEHHLIEKYNTFVADLQPANA